MPDTTDFARQLKQWCPHDASANIGYLHRVGNRTFMLHRGGVGPVTAYYVSELDQNGQRICPPELPADEQTPQVSLLYQEDKTFKAAFEALSKLSKILPTDNRPVKASFTYGYVAEKSYQRLPYLVTASIKDDRIYLQQPLGNGDWHDIGSLPVRDVIFNNLPAFEEWQQWRFHDGINIGQNLPVESPYYAQNIQGFLRDAEQLALRLMPDINKEKEQFNSHIREIAGLTKDHPVIWAHEGKNYLLVRTSAELGLYQQQPDGSWQAADGLNSQPVFYPQLFSADLRQPIRRDPCDAMMKAALDLTAPLANHMITPQAAEVRFNAEGHPQHVTPVPVPPAVATRLRLPTDIPPTPPSSPRQAGGLNIPLISSALASLTGLILLVVGRGRKASGGQPEREPNNWLRAGGAIALLSGIGLGAFELVTAAQRESDRKNDERKK